MPNRSVIFNLYQDATIPGSNEHGLYYGFAIKPPLQPPVGPGFTSGKRNGPDVADGVVIPVIHYSDDEATYGSAYYAGTKTGFEAPARDTFNFLLNVTGDVEVDYQFPDES